MRIVGYILTVGVSLASGCAFIDGTEMESEKPPVSPPVIEKVTAPVAGLPTPVVAEPPPSAPARTLNRDEVRRLQQSLRDIGLDPGPIDGVAGTRTKLAFTRLQGGCESVLAGAGTASTVSAQAAPGSGAAMALASREEILKLQHQLRRAGFDPGPADGIVGGRTKAALVKLQAGCQVAEEFEGYFSESSPTASQAELLKKSGESAPASIHHSSREALTQRLASQTPDAREEVRILQLRLRDAGFDPGPFDGVMGPKTRLALEQFEAKQGGKKIKTSLELETITGQY